MFLDFQLTYAAVPTRITICSGAALTLNCTINSGSHVWNVSALNSDEPEIMVNKFQGNLFTSQYNISLVPNGAKFIVSTLTVVITDELNGTILSCWNTFDTQVIQKTVITILSMYVSKYSYFKLICYIAAIILVPKKFLRTYQPPALPPPLKICINAGI